MLAKTTHAASSSSLGPLRLPRKERSSEPSILRKGLRNPACLQSGPRTEFQGTIGCSRADTFPPLFQAAPKRDDCVLGHRQISIGALGAVPCARFAVPGGELVLEGSQAPPRLKPPPPRRGWTWRWRHGALTSPRSVLAPARLLGRTGWFSQSDFASISLHGSLTVLAIFRSEGPKEFP